MKNANLVSRIVGSLALGLAAALAGTGCAKGESTQAAPLKTVTDFFPVKVGERTVRMQLAVTSAEQERGLMQRRDLGPDDGMLFPYRTAQAMHFWMHNTPTPLDIGFFDGDGVLLEIYPLLPFDEKTVSSRSDQLKFALEMNQGWYHEHGVRPGAKLALAAVAEALKARGFEPQRYGLPAK